MLVVVTGCDGCGKSTAVNSLASYMQVRGVKTQIVDIWSLNDRHLHPEGRFLSSDVRLIKECGNEMRSPERAAFLFWMIASSIRHVANGDPTTLFIADSFWAKHLGNEVVRGFPEATAFALIDLLPTADLTFLLRAPPDIALQRKKSKITRFECGSEQTVSTAGFLSHQTRLQAKLDQWAEERQWTTIDAIDSPESVHRSINLRVDALLEQIADAFAEPVDAAAEVHTSL